MNFIKNYYSHIAFSGFAIRLIACGASIGDAVALFALVGFIAWHQWLQKQEITKYNAKFENDVKVEFTKAAEELTKLKGVIGAINLGTAMNQNFRKAVNEPGRQ